MTDILWLGAHKTGTTFLQKTLDRSRPALDAAQTAYLDLDTFRRLYTRPLLNRTSPEAPADPGLLAAPGLRHRLIFDENIPALVQHALSPAGLYPDAVPRAAKVAAHLGLDRPTIVFGIRSFAGYLPSLYCETLKSVRFRRFRRFCVTDVPALSWFDLLARLHDAFPGSPMLVYRAEDLRGRERALLARVAGLPADRIDVIDRPERPGFSHRAVRMMHLLSRERPVTSQDVVRLNAEYPRTASSPAFDPWTDAERRALDARYADDIEAIEAAGFVEVLRPG